MKKLLFASIILMFILFQSCSVTKGVYDNSLKSTNPYKFAFTGSQLDFESLIKKILVQNGFSIDNFDRESGILTTNYKDLNEDEKFNMDMFVMAGVSVKSQKGKIIFVYKMENEVVNFEMSVFEQMGAQISTNAFTNIEKEYGGQKQTQGHPLNMKYKNLLLKDIRFVLR